jgi:tRNA-specific 2-thiouridylase
MRVLAAMSGGVDSSVAAARMVDAGHDVTGVHLALSSTPAATSRGSRGCCSLEDSRDARRVADRLGIAFYVWDMAERFAADVVEDFVAEYAAGRTPNPCLRCNERIKFAAVLDRALALGFDAVCTGHYARLVPADAPEGAPTLHRAVDDAKDQSYVLAVLSEQQLQHSVFPLGADTKEQVRAEAERRGLAVAGKPDSHDICFIPDGDTAGFLRRHLGEASGPIVDATTGDRLGTHEGTYGFTIGQRRGLRLDRPAPDGRPRYVLRIEPVSRTVTVGPVSDLATASVRTATPVWCGPMPELPSELVAQYRAHGSAVRCTVAQVDSDLDVVFADAQSGVAPGQTIVFYEGDRVVGSATIATTSSAASAVGAVT